MTKINEKKMTEGIRAASLASKVRARNQRILKNPHAVSWDDALIIPSTFYDEDVGDCVISKIQKASGYGLKPIYFPRVWRRLQGTEAGQALRRSKYAKGDMSSYGYLRGEESLRGEPVWEIAHNWFTLYFDYGGSCAIKGPRRTGKTLLGTQKICLPYIESHRHFVSGVYVDKIVSEKLEYQGIEPRNLYHYHSSMNTQLQQILQIKVDSLRRQYNENEKIASGEEPAIHPLVGDLIDEASLSRSKYRTTGDKAMQQMYMAAIAGHIGSFVVEIHPFDTELVWVRQSLTHLYEFKERGVMVATIHKPGTAAPTIKRVWGFTSLEQRIRDGDDYIKYRPYAPEAFKVDVDMIAMLDFINEQMEERSVKGKDYDQMDEIEQWEAAIKWLKEAKESQWAAFAGLTYGQVVFSIAIFLVKLEHYNNLNKGTDKYRPIKLTQTMVESIMADSPFPVKRGTLGEDVVKARRLLRNYDTKGMIREEVEKEILKKLKEQGMNIDDIGNLLE